MCPQRITHLCKLLNKPEDVIQRKLQGFLSVESLSDMATGSLEDGIGTLSLNSNSGHGTEPDVVINGRLPPEVTQITVVFIISPRFVKGVFSVKSWFRFALIHAFVGGSLSTPRRIGQHFVPSIIDCFISQFLVRVRFFVLMHLHINVHSALSGVGSVL